MVKRMTGRTGIFVGMMDRHPTYLIANASGVYGTPNVAAFRDEQAFDPDLVLSVDVRHYEFIDKGVKGPLEFCVVPPSAPVLAPDNLEADPATTAHGGYIPRRTRITKSDLAVHGYTAGCPACLTARLDDGIKRGNHSEECRARLEKFIGDDRFRSLRIALTHGRLNRLRVEIRRVQLRRTPTSRRPSPQIRLWRPLTRRPP